MSALSEKLKVPRPSASGMSALSEKLKVPRPIKQFSTARKSLDFLSRASGAII